jgi:hypothetical protein
MIALPDQNPTAAKEVHSLLSYVYPDFEKAYRNYPNIEDFLNLIEMAQAFNSEEFIESDLWPQARIEAVKRTVLSAVTEYIWGFFVSPQPPCPQLDVFFDKRVPLGNVIITFNWDLTVERALAHRGSTVPVIRQYSKTKSPGSITLLKPHGSIDWFEDKAIVEAGISETHKLDAKVFTSSTFRTFCLAVT